jgi:hypothetical protein
MVGVRERHPAADGDEARVANFGKDHGFTCPGSGCFSSFDSLSDKFTHVKQRASTTEALQHTLQN